MGASPIVSVCLPVYNGQKFVAQAIWSVLKQTYSDFELLIADDCSTDESLKIVESLAQQDDRIRFWRNSANVGLFANYNACLERSNGRYIKLFAQDDLLHEGNLESTVRIFEENPTVALVATRRAWIDEQGQDISEFAATASSSLYAPSGKIVAGREIIRQSLIEGMNFIGEPSTVMVRRSHCPDGFNTLYHHLGDLDLWLRTLRNGDYFYLDETLSYVRVHEDRCSAGNARELLFAPDIVRLSGQFEDLLAGFGDSYEQLLCRCSRALSKHVRFLAATNQLTAAALKSSRGESIYKSHLEGETRTDVHERILDDLLAFRELMFYVMRESQTYKPEGGLLHRQNSGDKEIKDLEAKLRHLLNSPSWKATRWLRELHTRAARVSSNHDPSLALERAFEKMRYLEYLRMQINRIKLSRSWRITRPLRKIGIL